MASLAYPQIGRTDRYVRRARLSLGADASERKLALATEEALRLCSLPGEEEGLVYYFRRLHVRGLPEDGDRGAWLRCFQSALQEQAAQTVHGSEAQAGASDAMFFHSQSEECEVLLAKVAARVEVTEW